ncbi:MAG: hypothetical protein IH840_14630, partial [Candidatus Heimdallarchaeota archaeon]|nr:hypothetical protein [Candidatus Heimdallarchaeota archaeon]
MRIKLRITIHILVLAILVLGSSGLTFQSSDSAVPSSSLTSTEIQNSSMTNSRVQNLSINENDVNYKEGDKEKLPQNHDNDGANPSNQIQLQAFVPDWELLSSTGGPEARRSSPLVYDSTNRKTILFSGEGADADTWAYDQPSNTWTEVTPLSSPSQRYGHRMVFDPVTEKVIMFGGFAGSTTVAETWIYDYTANSWTQVTPLVSPSARQAHNMVYDTINQVVLMHGGSGSTDTWVYVPAANTWTNLAPVTNPGTKEGAYYSFDRGSGRFIIGGEPSTPAQDFFTWAYDYSTNTWNDLNSADEPTIRLGYGRAMVYDPVLQKSILFGGEDKFAYEDTTWTFDDISNLWSFISTTNSPGARRRLGMSYDSYAQVIILFGGEAPSGYKADTWQYTPHEFADPSLDWEQVSPTGAPEARRLSPVVYDSVHRKTILFSGDGADADTWVYDQPTNTWTEVTPPSSPSQRLGHRMVFDPVTEKVIMFGGTSGGSETWIYDYVTNTWTQVTPLSSPSARYFHSMVYDTVNQVVLMYGGYPAQAETWAYDPVDNTWRNLAPATNSGSREGAYYSFDDTNARFIIFGGYSAGSAVADTWGYHYMSNTWTDLNSANEPSARQGYGSAMVYDPDLQKSILFGGYTTLPLDETWTFDYSSNSWTQLAPSTAPSVRWQHGIAYDSDAELIILFGGYDTISKGDTWLYTPHEIPPDSTPPVLDMPGDVSYIEGSAGNSITWIATDTKPDSYSITLNSIQVASGIWHNASSITYNVDGLAAGAYIFQINVTDLSDNSATDIIQVTVVDVTDPTITPSGDITISESSNGNSISWLPVDANPTTYDLFLDGSPLVQGVGWTSGITITRNVDGLSLGTHVYTLIVYDDGGNSATASITVTVVDGSIPIITSSGDIAISEGSTGNSISWIPTDANPTIYDLFLDGSPLVQGVAWTSGIQITRNVDGLSLGAHIYTLTVYDDGGNSASESITVTVVDGTNPTITSSGDISISAGSTGNSISWKPVDTNPTTYDLFLDGSPLIQGVAWISGVPITRNVDGLSLGAHIYTLTVYDDGGNSASESITV